MSCRCGSELPDGFYLCSTCGERFEYALAEVDATMQTLEAGLARTSLTAGYGERVNGGGRLHAPLPINEAVHDAKHALHTWLMETSLKLAELVGPVDSRTAEGLANYLTRNLETLRRQDYSPNLETQLRGLLREGQQRTNHTLGRVFAGQCAECQTDLYAAKDEPEARCSGCGTTYEVLKWRAHAATAKDYYIGTPADLSRKLSAPQYGYHITADQIRKWATRGKLNRANPQHNEQGQPIPPAYRLGDILTLATNRATKHPINGAA